jgi:hypothetical protein
MRTVTIDQINETLSELPKEKLPVVYDFISYLYNQTQRNKTNELILASEDVLKRDWDKPEEDEAWANL